MSVNNILRRITGWAIMALAAAVFFVFAMPSYRQGEPSVTGKKAEDFLVSVGGRQARLSDFRGKCFCRSQFLGFVLRFECGGDAGFRLSSRANPFSWRDSARSEY